MALLNKNRGSVFPCRFFLLFAPFLMHLSNQSTIAAENNPPKPMNVLFIAIDDLNHWVGHLGRNTQTKTPNIDRLAKRGVTFKHAYCAAPVCNPSRASLMSGMRPGTTGVYDNGQNWAPVISVKDTLTTQFLNAGYDVFGAGKIYHGSVHRDGEWTSYFEDRPIRQKKLLAHPSAKDDGVGGISFKPLVDDARLADDITIDHGITQLEARHDKPFFLALGLHKPHMSWDVPKKYYDLFPLDSIELPPTIEDDLSDVPPAGIAMANPKGDHRKILKSGRWKEAIQGYLAAIAYCDAQVGRLLDAFDRSPYASNTMIVLWGDHGWHLGEKEHWRKFALWEESTRTPFIWVVPGITSPDSTCNRTVDLMSVYPTICELAEVPIPAHVEGKSIKSLLLAPHAAWDHPAITTWHRNNHAIRTERWRYIHYADGSEELYDHEIDPYEWKNLANDPKLRATKEQLRLRLPERNVAELPRDRNSQE